MPHAPRRKGPAPPPTPPNQRCALIHRVAHLLLLLCPLQVAIAVCSRQTRGVQQASLQPTHSLTWTIIRRDGPDHLGLLLNGATGPPPPARIGSPDGRRSARTSVTTSSRHQLVTSSITPRARTAQDGSWTALLPRPFAGVLSAGDMSADLLEANLFSDGARALSLSLQR